MTQRCGLSGACGGRLGCQGAIKRAGERRSLGSGWRALWYGRRAGQRTGGRMGFVERRSRCAGRFTLLGGEFQHGYTCVTGAACHLDGSRARYPSSADALMLLDSCGVDAPRSAEATAVADGTAYAWAPGALAVPGGTYRLCWCTHGVDNATACQEPPTSGRSHMRAGADMCTVVNALTSGWHGLIRPVDVVSLAQTLQPSTFETLPAVHCGPACGDQGRFGDCGIQTWIPGQRSRVDSADADGASRREVHRVVYQPDGLRASLRQQQLRH